MNHKIIAHETEEELLSSVDEAFQDAEESQKRRQKWERRNKTIVVNVEKIKKGHSKQDVETLLGEADSPNDKEWVYYLDEHSGYIVAFASTSRVESVNAWRS
jgi:hypothetical protein